MFAPSSHRLALLNSVTYRIGLCILLALTGSYTLQAQTILSTHPRIWATPQRLQQLKNYAARNTQRWQNVKASADRALADSANTDREYIPPLSVVYQVTGNTTYAQQAIKIMLANAVSSNTLTDNSGWEYRYSIPDITFGYDWCYSQMTPAQRNQVATWLMDRADAVWPETTPSQAGAWGVDDPANNYFWGFYDTWPAALAVYGDGTDTHIGSVSGSNRPKYHINLALSKWTNLIRPFMDSWGIGGVFAESTNYDSMFWVSHILDAYNTAAGVDLTNQAGFKFVHDSIYWRIYSTVPTHDYYYNLGTQSRVPIGDTTPQDRERALVPTATLTDTTVQQYGKFWLDHLSPSITDTTWWWVTAWEFLYYNEDAPSTDYTTTLPTGYFASGPGLLTRRSDWSSSATYWGIWAGPLQESHQYFDVNGFLIYKGNGWLVGNDSMWSNTGVLQDTVYHNNLTFGGLGQTWQYPNSTWPNEAGQTLKQENTSEYTYFAGQGAQAYVQTPYAYGGGTQVATDYVRKVAYVSPSLFFIYDRATLLNPNLAKEWHLHSQKPIAISGRSYSFDNGQYRVFGQSLLPGSGVTLSSASVGGSSYRLDVVTNNHRATDTMLNVLQIAPVSTSSVPPSLAFASDQGNMEGAISNGWVVLMGKSELINGTISYTVNPGVPTEHLVTDLQPSANYSVAVTDLTTNSTTTTTIPTNANGTLRFTATGLMIKVVLSSTTGQVTPPALTSIAVAPSSVTGGNSATGTVTLSGPAPSGGVSVTLASNNATTIVPGNVTVTAGVTSATFSITTKAVTANTNVTLSAVYNGVTKTAGLTVLAPATVSLSSVSVSPSNVIGGNAATGTVTLSGPAPSGGVSVTLASNNATTIVPGNVTVTAGVTSATFSITTKAVTANTNVTLSAVYNGVTKTAGLTVLAPVAVSMSSVSVSPSSVVGGNSVTGTVTLTGHAPTGGFAVILTSSNNAAATVPTSVTVTAGATSATFPITTKAVSANTTITLSATIGSVTKTANLTVQPVAVSSTFVLGVALGGPAVTIEGNPWLSYASALASGLSVSNAQTGQTSSVPLTPAPDANTATMLRDGIWTPGTANGVGFTLKQTLPNGNYQVYLWEVEDDTNSARNMNVLLQGVTVASGIGNQALGHWSKYGPYAAAVTNGVLTLSVVRGTKGDPQLMGLAIFKP